MNDDLAKEVASIAKRLKKVAEALQAKCECEDDSVQAERLDDASHKLYHLAIDVELAVPMVARSLRCVQDTYHEESP